MVFTSYVPSALTVLTFKKPELELYLNGIKYKPFALAAQEFKISYPTKA